MKYIKLYESTYDLDFIKSLLSGVDGISEDDDYYIINNLDIYLTNKEIQLNWILKNKTVQFYCYNHMKYEELKITNVKIEDNDIEFSSKNDFHYVDKNKQIKISKLHIATDKYNL